ncbi:hypothetical protein Hypma_004067 [Hypsizygus marmoreus]|uniref:Uncharacterized protein n=1 Tax=Hypsizygus marmoreus TaxID=39966 RepID=A0A369J4P4_HYPMA|nr:hypothetical protein Hypma_004067 [Hypsizygus marmoreus]
MICTQIWRAVGKMCGSKKGEGKCFRSPMPTALSFDNAANNTDTDPLSCQQACISDDSTISTENTYFPTSTTARRKCALCPFVSGAVRAIDDAQSYVNTHPTSYGTASLTKHQHFIKNSKELETYGDWMGRNAMGIAKINGDTKPTPPPIRFWW